MFQMLGCCSRWHHLRIWDEEVEEIRLQPGKETGEATFYLYSIQSSRKHEFKEKTLYQIVYS